MMTQIPGEMFQAFQGGGLGRLLEQPAFADALLPSIRFRFTTEPCSRSALGIDPTVAEPVLSDTRTGRLDCLIAVSLSDLRGFQAASNLPMSGTLLFFYDLTLMPLGLRDADQEHWRVVYAKDSIPVVPAGQRATTSLPFRYLQFFEGLSIPGIWSPRWRQMNEELRLSEDEIERFDECIAAYERRCTGQTSGWHRMLGYPFQIYPGMEDQLPLQVSQHDASGQTDDGGVDWSLLIQLDSDKQCGLEWDMGGSLYVWRRDRGRPTQEQSCFWDIWCRIQS